MKALVTGAAGFIGSNLVEAMVNRGDTVVAIDNLSTGRLENLKCVRGKPNFTFVQGDVRSEDVLKTACRGVEVVFHEAAMPSVQRSIENPKEAFDVNAGGTLNVLLAAKSAGARRVVFASSSSIYGNAEVQPVSENTVPRPISPYGASKLAAESLGSAFSASFGLNFYALRYFNVFGPRQDPKSEYAAVVPKFFAGLTNGTKPVIFGDGLQTRDFTYVGNVVNANLLAADKSDAQPGAYNIAAGSPHTVNELLETLCRILGKPFEPVYKPKRAGDILHSSADVRNARLRLGYQPDTDFLTGLRYTCQAAVGEREV